MLIGPVLLKSRGWGTTGSSGGAAQDVGASALPDGSSVSAKRVPCVSLLPPNVRRREARSHAFSGCIYLTLVNTCVKLVSIAVAGTRGEAEESGADTAIALTSKGC